MSSLAQRAVLGSIGAQLTRYRAARSAVLRGDRNCKIACIGDSTTRGTGASSTGDLRQYNAWPARLARLLDADGFTARHNSFFGTGVPSNDVPAFDETLEVSGFTAGGVIVLGGLIFQVAGAGTIDWTPYHQWDTCEIGEVRLAAGGSYSHAIDGGAATTQSQAATNGFYILTKTVALGTHTLNLARVSGTARIVSGYAYNSAIKEISVMNMGYAGVRATQYAAGSAGQAYNTLAALQAIAPDLTILLFPTNDVQNGAGAGETFANTISSLQSFIDTGKLTGDVILVTFVPLSTALASATVQKDYLQPMKDLARRNRIPLVDVNALFGDYVTANAAGRMFDTLHPNGTGYADIAGLLKPMLVQ